MLLLRRVFSRLQWGALCISLAGVCLVQLGSGNDDDGKKGGTEQQNAVDQQQQQFLGLVTVFVMCWTSAFAGMCLIIRGKIGAQQYILLYQKLYLFNFLTKFF
jgi:drug/metabolite transporter (DMT)-like permease